MEKIKAITSDIKIAMGKSLSALALTGLEEANKELLSQSGIRASSGKALHDEKEAIVERFSTLLASNFDELLGDDSHQEVNILDYGTLTLVEEDDLEAIIAMEGMIAHSRNCDIQQYLSFTTRLNTMFYGTNIDESNNPMDPEQIGAAFREAMRPVAMSSAEVLTVYRAFNSNVFHKLEQVLTEANEIMIKNGIVPDLDIEARNKKLQINKRSKRREKSDPTDRAFSDPGQSAATEAGSSQQLLSMMQNLMHGAVPQLVGAQGVAVPAGMTAVQLPTGQFPAAGYTMAPVGMQQNMMVGQQHVELVANDQLMSLLGEIQSGLTTNAIGGGAAETRGEVNLAESLGELLQQNNTKETLHAIDAQSSDIINLVTLLYEAIWSDETVPIPVKELIGRTQITTLKIALQDSTFFDIDDHPARVLINELATAGISWTDYDKLEQDPMYCKMQELVERLVSGYDADPDLLESLLEDFRAFKQQRLHSSDELENQFKDADERRNRLDELNEYAHAKISERVLDEGISPIVSNFLETLFQKFVVQVLLREGPAGISWKPIMNTIDVLLWTVQDERSEDDRERFIKVNPRLMVNLGKALDLAGVEKEAADSALKALQEVQEECFKPSRKPKIDSIDDDFDIFGDDPENISAAETRIEILPDDDEHLLEVSNYPIGIWLEFQAGSNHTIRCTLAARIDTIDKFIFVNGQGVKVVEISRMGLAGELKAGTVKVISEAPLIDRAMESVIGKLRENRNERVEEDNQEVTLEPK